MNPSERWVKRLAWLLGIALLVRLLSLAAYPLMETTEPRYAEIARKMLETGNWVTPWFDHGVPFWGKPPMSFWASAATMAVFGVNEFGARLAPFLATLGTVALLWGWPRGERSGQSLPLAAGLITVSSLVGFVSAGAVMTDMFMVMGTTLCMVAFWRAVQDETARSPWGWAFFVGIAIGLLAKGPVATVLTGLALAPWVVLSKAWRVTWHRLPWVRGSLLLPGLVALGLMLFPELPQSRSQRELLSHWPTGEPLAYLGPRPFSAGFYSRGQARWLQQPQETAQWLASSGPATLVLEHSILAGLTSEQLKSWNKVAEHAGYVMLRRVPAP